MELFVISSLSSFMDIYANIYFDSLKKKIDDLMIWWFNDLMNIETLETKQQRNNGERLKERIETINRKQNKWYNIWFKQIE